MSEKTENVKQEQEAPNAFLIGAQLAQALVNYLGSKPYAEVKNLILGLENSRPVNLMQAEEPAPQTLQKVEDSEPETLSKD